MSEQRVFTVAGVAVGVALAVLWTVILGSLFREGEERLNPHALPAATDTLIPTRAADLFAIDSSVPR